MLEVFEGGGGGNFFQKVALAKPSTALQAFRHALVFFFGLFARGFHDLIHDMSRDLFVV